MNDDMELVREYATRQSEPAFETLVTRYVNLVYATAVRHVGDAHLAEEITQAVFILLARKAGSLGPKTIVPSWLHRTAGFAAADALKRQRRWRQRESAAHMQTPAPGPENEEWLRLTPLLDAAIDRLGEKDRRAIVLRFLQQKSLHEVAAATGVSEEAAKKRVARALERLRRIILKHGVDLPTESLAGGIASALMPMAPASLAQTAKALALAQGAAAPASTLVILQGVLKQMAWAKWKCAAGIGAATLLAVTAAVVLLPNAADSNRDDHNDRYQIEGEVAYGAENREFTLVVNGSNWMVHLTHPQPDPEPAPAPASKFGNDFKPVTLDYRQLYEEEAGLDGSVYTYLYYGQLPSGDPAGNNGSAMIEYGNSPVSDFTLAKYVWAGLASGRYFSSITDGVATPLSRTSPDPGNDRINAQWVLHEAAPFLPKSIDYFQGKIERTKDPFRRFKMIPSDTNHTIGELRVLQEKTINGQTFPMEYTFEQFRPKFPGEAATNDPILQATTTVRVWTIRLHDVPEVLPPKVQGETVVRDERYIIDRQGERIEFHTLPGHVIPDGTYFVSRGRLPGAPDVKALKKFEAKLAVRLSAPSPH